MSTEEAPRFLDAEMTDNTQPSHPIVASPGTPSHDHFKTSKYSTGILTTSGWTPLSNSKAKWKAIHCKASDDVEELLKCHKEERDRYLASAKAPSYSNRDAEADDHNSAPVAQLEQYLDYDSYFRHAGWEGCASLEQRITDVSQTSTTPAQAEQAEQAEQADDSSGGPITVASTSILATLVAHESHNTKDSGVEPAKATTGTELAGQPVGVEDLPMQTEQVKPAKAFFHPEEDAWLLLFHTKVKAAAEAGRNIKLPGPPAVLRVFNSFFEGRVMKDERGDDLPPRRSREETSLRGKVSKMHSKIWKLRDVTRKLLEGKRGGAVYVPEITEEELRQYRIDGSV